VKMSSLGSMVYMGMPGYDLAESPLAVMVFFVRTGRGSHEARALRRAETRRRPCVRAREGAIGMCYLGRAIVETAQAHCGLG
jgi:hypothetical protein